MAYKQSNDGECGNYAFLVALEKAGIKITEKEILELGSFITDERGENKLISKGYITNIFRNLSQKIADKRLARGIYVVAQTSKGNFNSAKKHPFILTFDGESKHFFVIKNYDPVTGLYRCQNSWGDKWGDKGDFYMRHDDYRFLWETSCVEL